MTWKKDLMALKETIETDSLLLVVVWKATFLHSEMAQSLLSMIVARNVEG